MEMTFSHLGYPSNVPLGSNQSPVTSSACEPLGNLLSSYSSSLSPPDHNLVGLYNPAYAAAAAQSRFFSLSSPTGVSPPVSGVGGGGGIIPPPVCGPPTHPPPPPSMHDGLGPPPPPTDSSAAAAAAAAFYPAYPVSRDMSAAWRPGGSANHLGAGPQPGYPYDHTSWQSAYAYPGSHALDLNGARRKNATRESTATLKAWLQEHIKNPYPTKGEKIMLAIITKMTLTQVSTWFANARRRLKKENKMTWSPRNRTDDGDMDDNSKDGVDMETGSGGGGGLHDSPVGAGGMGGLLGCGGGGVGLDRTSVGHLSDTKDSSPDRLDDCPKPKIWSLAMTATSCGSFSFHNNNNTLPSSAGGIHGNTKPSGCLSPLGGGVGGMGSMDHLSMKHGSSPPSLQHHPHHTHHSHHQLHHMIGGGHLTGPFFTGGGGGASGMSLPPRLLDSGEGM